MHRGSAPALLQHVDHDDSIEYISQVQVLPPSGDEACGVAHEGTVLVRTRRYVHMVAKHERVCQCNGFDMRDSTSRTDFFQHCLGLRKGPGLGAGSLSPGYVPIFPINILVKSEPLVMLGIAVFVALKITPNRRLDGLRCPPRCLGDTHDASKLGIEAAEVVATVKECQFFWST